MANSFFDLPTAADLTQQGGTTTMPWMQWFQRIQNVAQAVYGSGTTANRPTVGLWIGRSFFDTTLNKPVWVSAVKPAVWRDATAAVV